MIVPTEGVPEATFGAARADQPSTGVMESVIPLANWTLTLVTAGAVCTRTRSTGSPSRTPTSRASACLMDAVDDEGANDPVLSVATMSPVETSAVNWVDGVPGLQFGNTAGATVTSVTKPRIVTCPLVRTNTRFMLTGCPAAPPDPVAGDGTASAPAPAEPSAGNTVGPATVVEEVEPPASTFCPEDVLPETTRPTPAPRASAAATPPAAARHQRFLALSTICLS
jgi:hypothetical protein